MAPHSSFHSIKTYMESKQQAAEIYIVSPVLGARKAKFLTAYLREGQPGDVIAVIPEQSNVNGEVLTYEWDADCERFISHVDFLYFPKLEQARA